MHTNISYHITVHVSSKRLDHVIVVKRTFDTIVHIAIMYNKCRCAPVEQLRVV